MKKRLVALTLVAAMALGMTACGSKSNNKTTNNDTPDTAVSTAVDWTSYDELVDSIRTETDLAKRAKAANEKYCNPIWTQMGGSSEQKCADKGLRTDGKAMSRILELTPGSKKPFIMTVKQGVGESNEQGLIVPRFGTKPDVQILVAFDADTLKQMALMINTHIDGFISAQYARGAYEEEVPEKKAV